VISFFLLSFSLDEKETIPQGGTRQKNASTHIPKAIGTGLARFFAGPTHTVNGIVKIDYLRFVT
jgi:hypothetical protein